MNRTGSVDDVVFFVAGASVLASRTIGIGTRKCVCTSSSPSARRWRNIHFGLAITTIHDDGCRTQSLIIVQKLLIFINKMIDLRNVLLIAIFLIGTLTIAIVAVIDRRSRGHPSSVLIIGTAPSILRISRVANDYDTRNGRPAIGCTASFAVVSARSQLFGENVYFAAVSIKPLIVSNIIIVVHFPTEKESVHDVVDFPRFRVIVVGTEMMALFIVLVIIFPVDGGRLELWPREHDFLGRRIAIVAVARGSRRTRYANRIVVIAFDGRRGSFSSRRIGNAVRIISSMNIIGIRTAGYCRSNHSRGRRIRSG
ncbi:hypothetical protein ACHAXS_001478 [Conticribra weissflogii]